MDKDTGGNAFPSKSSACGGSSLDSNGMTLRDYFAAKVVSSVIGGYVSSKASEQRPFDSTTGDGKHAAEFAYRIADAMLEARK